jgi:cyclin B
MMDFDDPQSLAEYMPDLYLKIKQSEQRYTINPKYMDAQEDISSRMRGILIDWIVEVHMKFRQRTSTLFLTVNIIDRYLQAAQVPRRKLQLVGIVALLLASKFEEIAPVLVKDMVYICDSAYTKEDVITCESLVLASIGFDLTCPTADHFLPLYQKANQCDECHSAAVQYLLELSLLDVNMVGYSPSKVVAAATLTSNVLLHRDVAWPEAMDNYTGYNQDSLQSLVDQMLQLVVNSAKNPLQAVRRKYQKDKYHCVASVLSCVLS